MIVEFDKLRPNDMVYMLWLDAFAIHQSVARSVAVEGVTADTYAWQEVGFYVAQNEDNITIARSYAAEADEYKCTITVPKSIVKACVRLDINVEEEEE